MPVQDSVSQLEGGEVGSNHSIHGYFRDHTQKGCENFKFYNS